MKTAAFFDLDRTLIRYNSGAKLSQSLFKAGKVSFIQLFRSLIWLSKYKANLLDFEQFISYVAEKLQGKKEEELKEEAQLFVEKKGFSFILPSAQERIALHLRAHDFVVMITSSFAYLADPFARHLGISEVLCSSLEVKDERFTGKWIGPLCYGDGKVFHAESWADQHGISLENSYFYSDSYSDLPLLQKVGCPRVINPDRKLRSYARKHHWLIENW